MSRKDGRPRNLPMYVEEPESRPDDGMSVEEILDYFDKNSSFHTLRKPGVSEEHIRKIYRKHVNTKRR